MHHRAQIPGRTSRRTLAFLQDLLSDYRPRDFAVRLWDGTGDAAPGAIRRFTLVINHPAAVRGMLRQPREARLAEAFLSRDIDVEGDLNAVFLFADHLIDRKLDVRQRLRLGMQLLRLPHERRPEKSGRRPDELEGERHSRERDRQAVSYHYDLSNEFYSLWLDSDLVYSCAYFSDEQEDLYTAQQRKLDYLCRKLRLKRGERLLDIGCGWGGLVRYAAREYGVEATGITLSSEQARFCAERIGKEGLADRCSVRICDYRDLQDRQGFDKVVSVGMFEHVGAGLLPVYFRTAAGLLKPGGVFLNHGIAMNPGAPARPDTFSDRYVFPDGDLLPLSTTLWSAERSGFEVRDVESLREHYALTLTRWSARLEANLAEARRLTDDMTCRIWRLYLAGSAHSFRSGRLNVYQTLLVKSGKGPSGLPLTRGDWYQTGAG